MVDISAGCAGSLGGCGFVVTSSFSSFIVTFLVLIHTPFQPSRTTMTTRTTLGRMAINKVVVKVGACGPDHWKTKHKVPTDGISTAGDNRGIPVGEGRKGKGQPLLNVRDIAAQLKIALR